MIVKSIRVSNFRSVLNETLLCDSLTALVGPNGAGKSTFLNALDLFYSPSPTVLVDDFYNHDSAKDIEIAITFTDLIPQEAERFKSRMTGSDLLVMRVLSAGGGKASGKYYGFKMVNPAFQETRLATGRELLSLYKSLNERYGYILPSVRSQADAEATLEAWEAENPDKLVQGRDDGQFFGFTNVARGYLGDLTRFLFIPAVRDAGEDASEGRSSAITTLMDLVVRATLNSRSELTELKNDIQKRYREITDPEKLPELGLLAGNLTDTLQQYYPDTSVEINWMNSGDIDLPLPKADVKIVEGMLGMPVSHMGHGLQRAFILTLLQHLAVASAPQNSKLVTPADTETPEAEPPEQAAKPPLNLILGIEEPELYQHPSRQRHFARVLMELANGEIPGVASRTQILYATHSALLVDVDKFDQVRRVTRVAAETDVPKVTSVVGTSWGRVAEILWKADGSVEPKYTGETLKARVTTLMTPWMNEGFFADMVVLVEGEDDRAAILGIAQLKGINLESFGCTVIPCGGKASLDRPAVIFGELGIPTYLIWDGDNKTYAANQEDSKQESIKANRRLLNLCGKEAEDWPCGVSDGYACFQIDLEKTLETEIGEALFNELLAAEQAKLGILKKKYALKNPTVIANVLRNAAERGMACATIETIVDTIFTRAKDAHKIANPFQLLKSNG